MSKNYSCHLFSTINIFIFLVFLSLVGGVSNALGNELTVSQQTFISLINSNQSSTLSLSMYLGGASTIGNSTSSWCGVSMDNPCTNFNQLMNTFNTILFNQFENFTKTEGNKNVYLRILVLSDGSIFCSDGSFVLVDSMKYFIEINSLFGSAFMPTIGCFSADKISAISIPRQVNTVYIHNLKFEQMVIKYDSTGAVPLNIILENCVFLDVLIGEAMNYVRKIRARYYIVEGCTFYSVTNPLKIVYTEEVKILKSSLYVILGIQYGNNLNIVDSSLIGLVVFSNFKSISMSHSIVMRVAMNYVENVEFTSVDIQDSPLPKDTNSIIGYNGKNWTFKNCTTNRGHNLIEIEILDWLSVEELSFASNSYSSNERTLISCNTCYTVGVSTSTFPQGVGSIVISRYYVIFVWECNFYNNKSLVIGSVLKIESTTSEVSFWHSNFVGSSSQYGPVYIDDCLILKVNNCTFQDNKASISGGAIYIGVVRYALVILDSYFINNRVECGESLPNLCSCSGGVISVTSSHIQSLIAHTVERSFFFNNYASRGGVFYFGENRCKINLFTSEFQNNTALLRGSVGYFNYNNPLLTVNDVKMIQNSPEVAVFSERNNLKSVSVLGASRKQNEIFEVIIGKSYILNFTGIDGNGNEMNKVEDILSVQSMDERLVVLMDQTLTRVSFKLYFILRSNENLTMIGFNTTLIFKTSNNALNLSVVIGSCANGYFLDKTATEKSEVFLYDCKAEPKIPYELFAVIIIGCSLFLFVLGILLGLGIFFVRKIIKRLTKLKRKERAEKEIEEKLLDKKIVFNITEDEDEYYDSRSPMVKRSKSSYSNVHDRELVSSLINYDKKKFKLSSSFIIPIEDITIVKKIGEGGAANVYCGTWVNITVAIKSLKIDNFDDDFENEAAILSNISHPNILKLYGVCLTEKSKYIVTEYMEKGSLDRYIFLQKNRPLNIELFKTIIGILCGIVDGMQYLHSLNPSIIHRDLKSSNVLLDEKNNAKVSDFGLVKVLGNNTFSEVTKAIGTMFYMSPESFIADHEIENKEAAKRLDIYSYSIVMWELFFRAGPYQHIKNAFKVPQLIANGERPLIPFNIENDDEIGQWLSLNQSLVPSNYWINCIKKYFSILCKCWDQNPMQRPPFSVIRKELDEISNLIDMIQYSSSN